MCIAKILAPVTGSKRDTVVIKAAIAAARPLNAHVSVLYVHPDPRLAVPYTGAPLSPGIIQDIVDDVEKLSRDAQKLALETLTGVAAGEGIEVVAAPVRSNGVTCSFRTAQGFIPSVIGGAASLSDLVVFGFLSPDDGAEIAEGFVETLTSTDRPVLICPEAPSLIARKIAIGWDGGKSAARAISAAMPYLEKAAEIEVLTVQGGFRRPEFATLDEYLAVHGVKATHRKVDKAPSGTGRALLDAATQNGADLLVMGGYGHNYWRETLFGGVTAHVRWHATLPVFMMH